MIETELCAHFSQLQPNASYARESGVLRARRLTRSSYCFCRLSTNSSCFFVAALISSSFDSISWTAGYDSLTTSSLALCLRAFALHQCGFPLSLHPSAPNTDHLKNVKPLQCATNIQVRPDWVRQPHATRAKHEFGRSLFKDAPGMLRNDSISFFLSLDKRKDKCETNLEGLPGAARGGLGNLKEHGLYVRSENIGRQARICIAKVQTAWAAPAKCLKTED